MVLRNVEKGEGEKSLGRIPAFSIVAVQVSEGQVDEKQNIKHK